MLGHRRSDGYFRRFQTADENLQGDKRKPQSKRTLKRPLTTLMKRLNASIEGYRGLLAGATALLALCSFMASHGCGDSASSVDRAPRGAQLEITDVIVRDPSYKQSRKHARLEITVHNVGGQLVVVDGARIKVRQVYEIRRCTTQGDLRLSNSYGALLPVGAKFGYSFEKPLHQQIGPDRADRFGISFGTRIPANSEPAVYLFEIEIALVNDGPLSPLPAGRAIVSLPERPTAGQYFWDRGTIKIVKALQGSEGVPPRQVWHKAMPCWRRNTAILSQFLSGNAERSPEIKAIPRKLVTPSFSKLE